MLKLVSEGWFDYQGNRMNEPIQGANFHFHGYQVYEFEQRYVLNVWRGSVYTSISLPLGCAIFDMGVVMTKED